MRPQGRMLAVIELLSVHAPYGYVEDDIPKIIERELGTDRGNLLSYTVLKRSIDARKGLRYVMSFEVSLRDESAIKTGKNVRRTESRPEYTLPTRIQGKTEKVVIVGAGPCGLFAGLVLAHAGYAPLIIERGKTVDERSRDVQSFFAGGALDTESNVQFGEGGAGTFSDGKLNTGISDERISFVLKTFVSAGASEEILYDAKPHVGTDKLREIVKNIRRRIEDEGGRFSFCSRLSDVVLGSNGEIRAVKYERGGETFEERTDALVLAIGHSARDTYEMLERRGIFLEPKPFSIGVRIEHPQKMINKALYHDEKITASYKLSHRASSGRGVYTFCMCPGGYVVSGASEKGGIAVNGMSENARNGENSNSAILVGVNPSDYPEGALGGIEFQRRYERLAYGLTNSYLAPCQRYGDFKAGRESKGFGEVSPTYKPGVVPSDIRRCLPGFAVNGIREGIEAFSQKIRGFNMDDALLTGVETRSSSPVRITRKESMESLLNPGVYPAGEGAGYAGGITSSAVDGIKVAEKILERFGGAI